MKIHVVGYTVEPTDSNPSVDDVLMAGVFVFVKCRRYRQALRAAESYLKREHWRILKCAGGGLVVADQVANKRDAFNLACLHGLAAAFDMAPRGSEVEIL